MNWLTDKPRELFTCILWMWPNTHLVLSSYEYQSLTNSVSSEQYCKLMHTWTYLSVNVVTKPLKSMVRWISQIRVAVRLPFKDNTVTQMLKRRSRSPARPELSIEVMVYRFFWLMSACRCISLHVTYPFECWCGVAHFGWIENQLYNRIWEHPLLGSTRDLP